MATSRFFRAGAMLSAGGVVTAACGFARNVVIARLISVEDFGIASAFAMTISLMEMASNLALDRIIVQATDGDDRRVVQTAHAFQVLRGFVSAVVMFVAAGIVARLFGIPEVAWAFELLAIVPLIRSLAHLDIARFQRQMRYRPLVLTEVVPQILSVAAAAPVAFWLGDYRVMLVVVLLQVATTVVLSHIVAEQRYGWAWEAAVVRRMLAFGWPLLLDGLLIFLAFHGEKMLVGGVYGITDLGWYSIAVTLAMAPALLVTSVLSRLLLPSLSAIQNQRVRFAARYSLIGQVFLCAGVAYAIGLIVGGAPLITVLFGEKYATAASVLPWIALAFGVRIMRSGPALGAIALGRTRIAMYGNLIRLIGLVLAAACAVAGVDIEVIAMAGAVGEIIAFVSINSIMRMGADLKVERGVLATLVGAGLLCGGLIGTAFLNAIALHSSLSLAIAVVAATIVTVCIGVLCPQLRREAVAFVGTTEILGGYLGRRREDINV